jgi:molybdopterin converting factor subunit 1
MNEIKVLFFATLRDHVGAKSLEIRLPLDTTVGGLKEYLIKTYPRLSAARNSMMVAINLEYASDDQVIPADAAIALFPPVSGG